MLPAVSEHRLGVGRSSSCHWSRWSGRRGSHPGQMPAAGSESLHALWPSSQCLAPPICTCTCPKPQTLILSNQRQSLFKKKILKKGNGAVIFSCLTLQCHRWSYSPQSCKCSQTPALDMAGTQALRKRGVWVTRATSGNKNPLLKKIYIYIF